MSRASLPENVAHLARGVDECARLEPDGTLLLAVATSRRDNPVLALEELFERLRVRSSREYVRPLGRDQGYRLEDAIHLTLGIAPEDSAPPLLEWLRRRVRATVDAVARPGPWCMAAAFSNRQGGAPESAGYARGQDGRVRLEAFELHVAEHCNLRCANCCNMSPLVSERFLSISEVQSICQSMSGSIVADVLKIMGGEPLLHPNIVDILHILRASGVGDKVRLFTNGLLLHSMKDAFWEALDELTISNYSSAPVKGAIVEMARERSRRHGFVLNTKLVSEFSQVLSPRFEVDDAAVQRTYARCWLRHRCIVVRGGHFYMCTRAAYASDFLAGVAHEAPPQPLDRSGDGIAIDAPDLAARIEAYMSRKLPLGACRYCFGGDGAVEPHYQLTKKEVARGLLSRKLSS
ncbi:MAG TPA: radical SAM protein [Polyangiaceae bacterium]|nr:radical SAM protein [Polyangiaceae bacterium]